MRILNYGSTVVLTNKCSEYTPAGYTSVECHGNVGLLAETGSTPANKYWARTLLGTPIIILNDTNTLQIYQGMFAGWKTLAAESINGVNSVVWANVSQNALHIWRMSSTWTFVSKDIYILNSAAGNTQELLFGVDANEDGTIGGVLTVNEALCGYTISTGNFTGIRIQGEASDYSLTGTMSATKLGIRLDGMRLHTIRFDPNKTPYIYLFVPLLTGKVRYQLF